MPNQWKRDPSLLFEVMGRVQQGYLPQAQQNHVDLQGAWVDWAGPNRGEPYVFVIRGRNDHPGQFRRYFDSLVSQTDDSWGAIIVDDASDNGYCGYVSLLTAGYRDRVRSSEITPARARSGTYGRL